MPESKRSTARKRSYRRYVGPLKRWDELRDNYWQLLRDKGLLPNHTLCDVGCGVLRHGLPLIKYLEADKYFGIEPNRRMLLNGLRWELGFRWILARRPTFFVDDQFGVHKLGQHMDWVLAYAVFIHCGREQFRHFLRNIRTMVQENERPTTLMIDLSIRDEDAENGPNTLYKHASHDGAYYRQETAEALIKEAEGEILECFKWGIDTAYKSHRTQFKIQFEPK